MTSLQSPSILLQPVDKWTSNHLNFLRVDDSQLCLFLTNITVETDQADDEFLGYFLIPTQDILNYPIFRSRNQPNPFRRVFSFLRRVVDFADDPRAPIDLIESLLEVLWSFSARQTRLVTKRAKLLKIGALRIQCDGLFRQDTCTSVPVATFLVLQGSEEDKIYEIQQILAQAILAFKRQPEMDEFTSFVVCLTGTTLHLASAHVPWAYIEPLHKYQQPSLHLQICHSETYDLKIPDDRKGFAMLILRMLKYLDERNWP